MNQMNLKASKKKELNEMFSNVKINNKLGTIGHTQDAQVDLLNSGSYHDVGDVKSADGNQFFYQYSSQPVLKPAIDTYGANYLNRLGSNLEIVTPANRVSFKLHGSPSHKSPGKFFFAKVL